MADLASHEAVELTLYLTNDADCWQGYYLPVCRRLARFYDRGEFEFEKATRVMLRAVNEGARQYHREHGTMSDPWYGLFPKGDRDRVAAHLVDYFLSELRIGNRFWE